MSATVLVIDDSELLRKQVINIMRNASLVDHCEEASDGMEGFKLLLDTEPDLVICDLEMPGVDGFRFLELVKVRAELLDIPILILTGSSDRNSKLRALEQGASDYITKPFDDTELVARVRSHLKLKKLQDESRMTVKLKGTIGHLRALSNLDPLTNLCNRRFFFEILENEFQRAKRLRACFSVVIIDLDNFKSINDIYGHQGGDTVLVTVAETLVGVLRRYDFASRFGGDEFVLLLPSTPNAAGVEVAQRVLASLQTLRFAAPMAELSVTASIGVATYPSPQTGSVSALIHAADTALYQAKAKGRNRVETLLPAA